MPANSCHACGKADGKLLRCGQCRNVWFCNRECQVTAARQGHSGANCRPSDGAHTHKVAYAEVAPRLPDAAGLSTTASASLAPAANSCHACGKSGGKLLCCGRCKNVWFCKCECQDVARKELGHKGANCRPANHASANLGAARSRVAVDQLSSVDYAKLVQRFTDLMSEATTARITNSRVGNLAALQKLNEAVAVADLFGGEEGAMHGSTTYYSLAHCLLRSNDTAAAARAACSSLCAARVSGSRTSLVYALSACGDVANTAPNEMVKAERESREQERLSSSPYHGGLDLSQEGRIRLPTSPAALSRLGLAYLEAAVAICDAAPAAAGGRGSPAAADEWRVPHLRLEAEARAELGACLHNLGVERQRSLELFRQAVTLARQDVRTAQPGFGAGHAKPALASKLCHLGVSLTASGSDGMAEAQACLREALELSEETDEVGLKQDLLRNLANLSCRPDQPVGPTEAAAFRARLNTLYAQNGRIPDTSCTICLEPLEQPGGGAEEGAAAGAAGATDSCVMVLSCGHQFHLGCLSTWWRTTSNMACPLCKT